MEILDCLVRRSFNFCQNAIFIIIANLLWLATFFFKVKTRPRSESLHGGAKSSNWKLSAIFRYMLLDCSPAKAIFTGLDDTRAH
jgi:hypothetical protein